MNAQEQTSALIERARADRANWDPYSRTIAPILVSLGRTDIDPNRIADGMRSAFPLSEVLK